MQGSRTEGAALRLPAGQQPVSYLVSPLFTFFLIA